MATNTTKLALTKPDGTDLVDIAVLNANADKIDAASGATICTSTTRPASPWNGQVIFETDTLNALVYRSSTSSWTTIGGSTVSATPPTTAGSGNLWWDSDNGKLYIYYSDGNSSQWVAVIPGSGANQAATNVILNSDFSINQRNFTSSTAGGFGFDRWAVSNNLGTVTYSAQIFTTGSGPAPGIESANFARLVSSGQTGTAAYAQIWQTIENVRTLAGDTVTVSFYAKAASGTPKVAVEFVQNFGSGGTPSANVQIYAGQVTLSTSWTRYSVTVNVPSLTGKTIGTNPNTSYIQLNLWTSAGTDFNARTGSLGIQNNTFDFWGVQVEENPQASAYKRNQPNLQAELAACQRYYWRFVTPIGYGIFGSGTARASTGLYVPIKFPVTMRAAVTTVETTGTANQYMAIGTNTVSCSAVPSVNTGGNEVIELIFPTAGSLIAGQAYLGANTNVANVYLGFSAEL